MPMKELEIESSCTQPPLNENIVNWNQTILEICEYLDIRLLLKALLKRSGILYRCQASRIKGQD